MKKLSLLLCTAIMCFSCAEMQEFAQNAPHNTEQKKEQSDQNELSQNEISGGLKEALNKGIDKQVTKLTEKNGFYKNELVKIVLPEQLQQVESTLRKFGLGSLADEGIKAMNRAAEDAVARSTPIFVDAIKGMSFADAQSILMGNEDAATLYLKERTNDQLFDEFHPEINKSFSRVGADKIWSNVISKYNNLPLTEEVDPDLTQYVTDHALEGVYKMIAVEEKKIRKDIGERSTDLLKKVFSKQD